MLEGVVPRNLVAGGIPGDDGEGIGKAQEDGGMALQNGRDLVEIGRVERRANPIGPLDHEGFKQRVQLDPTEIRREFADEIEALLPRDGGGRVQCFCNRLPEHPCGRLRHDDVRGR